MNSQYFLDSLSNIINYYSNVYDNYIVIGDFNLKPSQMYLKHLWKLTAILTSSKIIPVSKDQH